MGDQHSDIAEALADAAAAIGSVTTLDEKLDALVHATRVSVPGFAHVGVSVLHHDGRIETKAATGPLVTALDTLQYDLGEGPCVTALHEPEVVVVEHLADDPRWPRYVPGAVERGVVSQMGIRLYADDLTLGSINFYSTDSGTVDPEAPRGAELFARHAALALGAAQREAQLNDALETRTVIGQAMGILMERYRLDTEGAFHFLVRASSTSNTKLRTVATSIVDEQSARKRSAR